MQNTFFKLLVAILISNFLNVSKIIAQPVIEWQQIFWGTGGDICKS